MFFCFISSISFILIPILILGIPIQGNTLIGILLGAAAGFL
jgi:hypothetical protein